MAATDLIDPRINSYPGQVIAEQLRDVLQELRTAKPVTVNVHIVMPDGFWLTLYKKVFGR